MRLESVAKFHSPKSPMISDSPRATASDSLSGTDVMAATGRAVDIAKTEQWGRVVEKECGRCKGVGYSRMPAIS